MYQSAHNEVAMEEEKITISIQVAQRTLSLKIQKEWEHYFREAEKVINENFLEFAKIWTYRDQQDLLSMLLVNFVVIWLADEQRLKEYDEELIPMMESLQQLTENLH